jgi:hypothetical protein
MKERTAATNSRARDTSRSSRPERGAAESTSSRRQQQQDCDASNAVCCDENLIGAERFARKGDDDDIE